MLRGLDELEAKSPEERRAAAKWTPGADKSPAVVAKSEEKPANDAAAGLGADDLRSAAEKAKKPAAKPDDKPAATKTAEVELDADTQKRLSAVQKAEKRAKETLAQERASFKAETEEVKRQIEQQWRPKVEQAQKTERLMSSAKHDADKLIELHGWATDELEEVAHAIYLRSPKAKADPAHKAHADKALRDREGKSEVGKLRAELDELKQSRTAEKQQAEVDAQVQRYLDGVVKKIGDETPLVKKLLEKNPGKTRERLRKVAARLADEMREEFGESAGLPKAADVVKRLEARRAARGTKREAKRTKLEDSIFQKYGLDAAKLRGAAAKKPADGEKTIERTTSTNGASFKDSKSAKSDLLALMPD